MTGDSTRGSSQGFTLIEVMVAMAITLAALMGTMTIFHFSEQQISQRLLSSRAWTMAESLIEAKRSVRWDRLLMDDPNRDGHFIMMHDDGQGDDLHPGDGVYSNG